MEFGPNHKCGQKRNACSQSTRQSKRYVLKYESCLRHHSIKSEISRSVVNAFTNILFVHICKQVMTLKVMKKRLLMMRSSLQQLEVGEGPAQSKQVNRFEMETVAPLKVIIEKDRQEKPVHLPRGRILRKKDQENELCNKNYNFIPNQKRPFV